MDNFAQNCSDSLDALVVRFRSMALDDDTAELSIDMDISTLLPLSSFTSSSAFAPTFSLHFNPLLSVPQAEATLHLHSGDENIEHYLDQRTQTPALASPLNHEPNLHCSFPQSLITSGLQSDTHEENTESLNFGLENNFTTLYQNISAGIETAYFTSSSVGGGNEQMKLNSKKGLKRKSSSVDDPKPKRQKLMNSTLGSPTANFNQSNAEFGASIVLAFDFRASIEFSLDADLGDSV